MLSSQQIVVLVFFLSPVDSSQVAELSGLDRHKATIDIPNCLIETASNLLSTVLTNFAIAKTWEEIPTKIKTLSYNKFKKQYKRILLNSER